MTDKINIPDDVLSLLSVIKSNGFQAFVVGGCVRDAMLGTTPKDWDICTSASPDEVIDILKVKDVKTIPTGLKHGTVTAVFNGVGYEITTFRKDSKYSDGRHPDSVSFVSDLKSDLARRDFTINAMAYDKDDGLIDYFGGIKDIEDKKIRCVGKADDRFNEDALRMMRALRFSSRLCFVIDDQTSNSIHRNKHLLSNISAERKRNELIGIIQGQGATRILNDYSDVITEIIPELKAAVGFKQDNKYHKFDVYEHIAEAVGQYEGDDVVVKLALLLHDIGKPASYYKDERGGHFTEHEKVGHYIAYKVVHDLKLDNKTAGDVCQLVLLHTRHLAPTEKSVKRLLNEIGEVQFRRLLEVRKADVKAHADWCQEEKLKNANDVLVVLDKILAEKQCFMISDLEINGNDIKALGVKEGKGVGEILRYLLDSVVDGTIQNNHDALISETEKFIKKKKG